LGAFQSEDDAYDIYNTDASKVGFSIRKSMTKYRSDKSLLKKYIVCSSQGHRQTESSKDITRLDCTARIQFNVNREGVWIVQNLAHEHNHYLASPDKSKKPEIPTTYYRSGQEANWPHTGSWDETFRYLSSCSSSMEEPTKFHSQEHTAIIRLVMSERTYNPTMHKHCILI
jgi:hypothetical protein